MSDTPFSVDRFQQVLTSVLSGTDLNLNQNQIEQLSVCAEMLVEWNRKLNLTAIVDEQGIAERHMLDSLTILQELTGLNEPAKLIDVGTGAGFPGLPLKIAKPDLEVVLLDSLAKRIRYLDEVIQTINLEGISARHGRAEDAARDPGLRECFDIAVARAVASLPVLCEYCLPFVRTGGVFVAMKGQSSENWQDANRAIKLLGGKLETVRTFNLPGTDMKRTVLVIRKVSRTPGTYPRKAGNPSRKPL